MAVATGIHIGTSGWHYNHWRGPFYPEKFPPAKMLDYYARHFDTVEINNSFYRLPDAKTFAAWRRRAPPRFLFAVKASRYLTHMRWPRAPRCNTTSRPDCAARRINTVHRHTQKQKSGLPAKEMNVQL